MDESAKAKKNKGALRTPSPERFATGMGVLFATLGSAVGLGNIWKFPSLTGANGGAAFLIVYIVCTLLVGLPVMIGEQVLGRAGRGDAVTALKRLSSRPWWLIGAAGVVSAFLIMAFYTEVAGWVFAYVFKSISGGLLSTDPLVTSQAFNSLVTSPAQSLIWQWIVLLVTCSIILLGVTKGIERTTRLLMPLLIILLVIVGIRSLTLPGAVKGLEFLFRPDFSKVTTEMVLTALGLAFFKLSLGMGCMITYGSYYGDQQNIPATATRVVFSDLLVSLLAGIAIFPAVFSFGFEPASGPSLLFITIPAVFASMPFGNIFLVLFFLLTAFAANGAMISLIEVIVAFGKNRFQLSRKVTTIGTGILLALFGSLAALSSSTLADVKIFGKTFFDLFDFLSSNVLLPIGGFFLAIFIGWEWGLTRLQTALANNGSLNNQKISQLVFFALRYVTPVLVLVILLQSLGLFS